MNINTIATTATRLGRKTNKKEAYAIITDMIEADAPPSAGQLAGLYAFFIPTPGKYKTPFQWVNMAISTEETRYYLKYVYVTDGTMVATDGHRLHLMPTDLEDGYYDKNGIKVDVDATYPNFRRVIPEIKGKRQTWNRAESEVVAISLDGKEGALVYKLPNGAGVNKKYWDAATVGLDTVLFSQSDKNAPVRIVFDDPDKVAVVMPCRL